MPDKRPNMIFIITDQQRYDTIKALGYTYMDTPNLDRLVNEGVTFTNCFVTAPSCVPSRASLFTGYYPHTTGILKNGDLWRHSWVELLSESGYRCVNIGKMHTYPCETPLGFHERYVVENKDRYLGGNDVRYYFDEWDKALRVHGLVKQQREIYRKLPDYGERLGAFEWKLPEELHSDMFVGDMATWWLKSYPHTEPLFLQIGFPGPHPPYDPIPRYAKPYLNRELPLPKVKDEELTNQPPPLLAMRKHNTEVDHDSIAYKLHPRPDQIHRQRAYYFANVSMIDEKIGQILEALKEEDYLDNSIVVFTSDHGDHLSDHGHSEKWTMYDVITHVPLIVWSPNNFNGGRIVDSLCQQMDISTTLLELSNIQIPQTIEAQSVLPALEGKPWEGRKYVFAEHPRDGILQEIEYMTMVRSKEWKLVHFLNEPFGQLFNLVEDPAETKNLWENPVFTDKKHEMIHVLYKWLVNSLNRTSDLARTRQY